MINKENISQILNIFYNIKSNYEINEIKNDSFHDVFEITLGNEQFIIKNLNINQYWVNDFYLSNIDFLINNWLIYDIIKNINWNYFTKFSDGKIYILYKKILWTTFKYNLLINHQINNDNIYSDFIDFIFNWHLLWNSFITNNNPEKNLNNLNLLKRIKENLSIIEKNSKNLDFNYKYIIKLYVWIINKIKNELTPKIWIIHNNINFNNIILNEEGIHFIDFDTIWIWDIRADIGNYILELYFNNINIEIINNVLKRIEFKYNFSKIEIDLFFKKAGIENLLINLLEENSDYFNKNTFLIIKENYNRFKKLLII